MPGSIRSMHLEHLLRNVQTDRGSLLHGRLLRWQFDTVTLAHRCRQGASTPSPNSANPDGYGERRVRRTAGVGHGPALLSTEASGRFSIAANVKLRPDHLIPPPCCSSAHLS